MEHMPQPTVDGELKQAVMYEPDPEGRTEPIIAPEPEPRETSDQVRERQHHVTRILVATSHDAYGNSSGKIT